VHGSAPVGPHAPRTPASPLPATAQRLPSGTAALPLPQTGWAQIAPPSAPVSSDILAPALLLLCKSPQPPPPAPAPSAHPAHTSACSRSASRSQLPVLHPVLLAAVHR